MPSGTSPYVLKMKTGVLVTLIRNLNSSRGLCIGTMLIITGLFDNYIDSKIVCGNNKGLKTV
jgi:hypothetical protein